MKVPVAEREAPPMMNAGKDASVLGASCKTAFELGRNSHH